MRSLLIAPLCTLFLAVADAAAAPAPAGPTVRDIVEFTQFVQPANENDDTLHEQISPDGTQAFIVTRRGDVASDKNRYEIQLLDMTPDHLATQRGPAPVTVFSAAMSRDNNFASQAMQDVRWADRRTLVFLARLDDESFQVYRLDVVSRELVQLTHETNFIVSYAVSQDLRRVVYAVQVPNPPLREGQHAVVVGNQSLWSVKYGQDDLRAQRRMYRFFVAEAALARPPRALGPDFPMRGGNRPDVSISPDGRWALLPRHEPERLAAWARQYPLIASISKKFGRSQQVDPLQYFSTPMSYTPRRMMAWRLEDGREQTIVDAPDDSSSGGSLLRPDRLWQGTGASVLLAGTHLPLIDGKSSTASHVIEYWPDSGRWIDVATLESNLVDAHALADGFVMTDGAKRREFHRRADGGWSEATTGADVEAAIHRAWTLRTIQGLNQPPDVYATGPSGQTVRLTALNPQFDADTWGEMRPYTWHDSAGRQWEGGLMSGSGLDAHSPHPLLIQTYGFTPDRFYLDGPNTNAGFSSAFAGRAFLRDGMLVLAMPRLPTAGAPEDAHKALLAFNDGVRAAVQALVREGRVDASKVGIIGFSSTGERVLNLVTFGDVPIRAATLADGDANTLFALTLTYGFSDVTWAYKEEFNEGLPFGDKLAAWVRNDSSLHTDCIRAALRIETYGPWILNNWDIYGMLRRQYKPVEMVAIPGGMHSLWTPVDRMVSLQGNVDWYAFWLAGKTRTAPLLPSETTESVATQFAQWRELERLKAADEARPRCVR